MSIVGLAAVGPDGLVGRDGTLPWTVSADLAWFRYATLGRPVIVGRTTFETLPPLPGRHLFVLGTPAGDRAGTVHASSDPHALLEAASAASRDGTVVIAGGAGCWAAYDTEITDWLITDIPAAAVTGQRSETDVHVPDIDRDRFLLRSVSWLDQIVPVVHWVRR